MGGVCWVPSAVPLHASRACDGGGTGFWTVRDHVRDIQNWGFSRELGSA